MIARLFLLLALVSQVHAERMLAISDIHFNPLAQCHLHPCKLSKHLLSLPVEQWDSQFQSQATNYDQDSRYDLIEQIQTQLQQQPVDKVLVLGDLLAHHFKATFFMAYPSATEAQYRSFVEKTMAYLRAKLKSAQPKAEFFYALGNNDSALGDYNTDPQKRLFAFLNGLTPRGSSFLEGGYYSTDLNAQTQLIVLNSNLFSAKANDAGAALANAQLQWLRDTLKNSKKSVWIMMHIPQGIDVYKSLYSIKTQSFWRESVSRQFYNLLKQHQDKIKLILSSHVHMETWRLYRFGDNTILNLSIPAISPVFGNNPGYKILTVEGDKVISYETYFKQLGQTDKPWGLLYEANLTDMPSIPDQKNTIAQFVQRFVLGSGHSAQVSAYFVPYYQCGMEYYFADTWQACTNRRPHAEPTK